MFLQKAHRSVLNAVMDVMDIIDIIESKSGDDSGFEGDKDNEAS